MPAITYEIGGKNTKLRQSLQDSKQAVRDFRQNLKAQTAGMHADAKAAGGGKGIFGNMLGGAVVGAAAAAGAIKKVVGAVDELTNASEQLNIPVETLSRMQRVMEGSGVETEQLRKALQNMNELQTAVKEGGSAGEAAAKKFAALGIEMQSVTKASPEELFYAVSDGLKSVTDEGKRASAALGIFGAKNGKMVSSLGQGSAEFKKNMAAARGVASNENAKIVDTQADEVTGIVSGAMGVGTNVLGATLKGAANVSDTVVGAFMAPEIDFKVPQNVEEYRKRREAQRKADAAKPENIKAAEQAAKAKADADQKEFQTQDKKRLNAIAQVAAMTEDVALTKEKDDISQRIASAQKDIADSLRSQWTFGEKYNVARSELIKKEYAYQASLKKTGDAVGQERALAERDEAKAKFLELKKTAIERAGMPIAEQNRLQEQEKQQARDRDRATRTLNAQERDKLDRQFRRGEITMDARDHAIQALNALKPDTATNDAVKETAANTKASAEFLKKFTDNVVKI